MHYLSARTVQNGTTFDGEYYTHAPDHPVNATHQRAD
jgi:hypothetical protein